MPVHSVFSGRLGRELAQDGKQSDKMEGVDKAKLDKWCEAA